MRDKLIVRVVEKLYLESLYNTKSNRSYPELLEAIAKIDTYPKITDKFSKLEQYLSNPSL